MQKNFGVIFKYVCWLLLFTGIGLLPIRAQQLKKNIPVVKAFETTDGQIFQASDVPPEVVKMLATVSSENLKTESFPTIYKVPLSKNLYLVTIIRNNDTESQFILFRRENDRLKEICRSSIIENAVTGATFFADRNNVLIIADVAVPPDFTNLAVFELKNEKLTNLGNLEIAEKNKQTGLHEDFISPANKAAAAIKTGVYYITFRANIYSDWGGEADKETKINSPVTFYYDKATKEFKIKGKK